MSTNFDFTAHPRPGWSYVAAIDPAGRGGNAWTFVLAARTDTGPLAIVRAREWVLKGSPLRPSDVMLEIAKDCRKFRVSELWSDNWSDDALADIAAQYGISLIAKRSTQELSWKRYQRFGTLLAERKIILPRNEVLRTDLASVRRRATQTGTVIHLPISSGGRHCDFAPSTMLALSRYFDLALPEAQIATQTNDLGRARQLEWESELAEERQVSYAGKRAIYGDDWEPEVG
jgi:hypothetical protein